ncbi:MAG: 1-deoxy-D-xylulose-5-phosphate synthase [Clostridia bacterium]|nr:1-deoxy-D-xylulose-5-phosphate synthase [Clostridia bacterium]
MSKLLKQINSPRDLKKIPLAQIDSLAAEIREFVINSVANTGGHLAPNLGVVELSLALHYVYNTPKDKLIWDVGHQSYIHKLLTGRKERFQTLRQFNGLSGFPKCCESEHDVFNTGHSSTSISAAVGMAIARDLLKEEYAVVAVIGDGALTGGMAFEALNHAGDLRTELTVVLNDNEMSISNNVGAMSSYLSRLRTDPMYEKGKEEIEQLLRKIPAIGPKVLRIVDRMKDSLKYLVVPGMLFEELGFTYLGLIDGHNFMELKTVLERAKLIKGPKLIHILTTKGKGYGPAEKNPGKFHGVGPFDVTTGMTNDSNEIPTYTEIFGKTIVELAEGNDKILAITAAMPDGTGLASFAKKFPRRFFDVGIAEQHGVTMAAGLATKGFVPVVAIYSTFLQRAYDQVLHDVCLQNLPVVFAIDRGGLVGDDGETHHGLFDLTYLGNIPNLIFMSPMDEIELRDMLYTATQLNCPVAVRYPRGKGLGIRQKDEFSPIPVGKGELLFQGNDLTLVAIGSMVKFAMDAANLLKEQGISAGVINSRFIYPLDHQLIICEAEKTGKIVTIEENILGGGFGSKVAALLIAQGTKVDILQLGIGNQFVEHGNVEILREKYGINAKGIVNSILSKFSFKSTSKNKVLRSSSV